MEALPPSFQPVLPGTLLASSSLQFTGYASAKTSDSALAEQATAPSGRSRSRSSTNCVGVVSSAFKPLKNLTFTSEGGRSLATGAVSSLQNPQQPNLGFPPHRQPLAASAGAVAFE